VQLSLVSFEKPERWADAVARSDLDTRLRGAGVHWLALRYHSRPRLLAKCRDVLVGVATIAREVRRRRVDVVHRRADVAMAMARWARPPASTKLLYDIRGFFSDERVDGGSWSRGSILDRAVRRLEAANWRRADAVVVLTEAARSRVVACHGPMPPHR
jgi:hypothetical protein